MQESTLLKISVVSSIIGLALLFFLSMFTKLENTEIKELSIADIDRTIKIQGLVSRVNPGEKITFLEIVQHNKMPVLVFSTNLTLNSGDEVEVVGKVTEYNGKVELIADNIRRV